MQIEKGVGEEIRKIPWLVNCGSVLPDELGHLEKASDEQQAQSMFASDLWADVKTEAQGDLTGYLAKFHYDVYGVSWNSLAKDASDLVEESARDALLIAVRARGWKEEMVDSIVVDLTRAIVERSYQSRFRKVPLFFSVLFEIYKAGRLPCGWSGDLSQWPSGRIVVY